MPKADARKRAHLPGRSPQRAPQSQWENERLEELIFRWQAHCRHHLFEQQDGRG